MSHNALVRWLRYAVHGQGMPRRSPRRPRRGPARNWRYRAWIRTLPSVVSGRMGCEACHTKNNGMRSKGSCYTCVPLTPEEHRQYDAGRQVFERRHGISMPAIVAELNHAWFAHAAEVK
jgi:hypothetical protein